MLRNEGFVLLTIMINLTYKISAEQIISTNGWTPMSHNDIYNQIRRESVEYPGYRIMKSPMHYQKSMNFVQRHINPKNDNGGFKENFKQLNEMLPDMATREVQADKSDQINKNIREKSRTAKKAWRNDLDINVDNIIVVPKISAKPSGNNKEKNTRDEIAVAATNTYQVTEDIDNLVTTEENVTEFSGYQYNPPINKTQNVTSTFYKILSKYNINADDKLQNYDLSLKNKVQNPSTNVYRVPLQNRYNSLNHLPVDPLLAVFLSNYGFYLPSLYGIKTNYNNLYGYLASNNIHNNKPFGLYKIFSDTDSWN